MKHIVMFSSGAGSWKTAQRVRDRYGLEDMTLLFSDVKGSHTEEHSGEDADNYRFLEQAAANIGLPVTRVSDPLGRDIWDIYEFKRFIGNARIANCSDYLKQRPARAWLDANCATYGEATLYVGIDWTETHRVSEIAGRYAPWHVEFPLTEPPYVDKDEILAELRALGIEPPRLYEQGFAHANCGGFCCRAGQGHFKTLLEQNPDRYRYHEAREEGMRTYLGKDVSILRDRRGGKSRPMTLREFREQLEGGGECDTTDIGGCACI
jgi:hypothetical protein